MRRHIVSLLVLALTLAACGDDPVKPKGPVTVVVFAEPIAGDTVRGLVVVDGSDTLHLPVDSIVLPRGVHTFESHLDVDYLPGVVNVNVDPFSTRMVVEILQEGTCRIFQSEDRDFCIGRNFLAWPGSRRLICPANDFGDMCTFYASSDGLGGTWPADTANEYITHARLLIGAIMGAGSPGTAEGDTIATALMGPGDFMPRSRLRQVSGDSSRYQVEVWTDARHVPFFFSSNDRRPLLPATDRADNNLGLSVRTTYYLPRAVQNALFIRFDVKNITTEPDYRRVHPEEPAGGHTIRDIYLSPMVDPGIGAQASVAAGGPEAGDDNATVFPAESLLVAYDQEFRVENFAGGYDVRPGLVGLQVVETPPGVGARAIIIPRAIADSLEFITPRLEDLTYIVLAAGRAGPRPGSSCTITDQLFNCSAETPHDVLMGWSVGPIAQLAPGESTHLTVALLIAPPEPGTFTSGTAVAPQNSLLDDTNRAIHRIAAQLRTLAAEARTVDVNSDGQPGAQH